MTSTFAPSESSTLVFDGVALPRGLREAADAMSWSTFTATYAPTSGPLRLGRWCCADSDPRSNRLGPRTFQATLAIGDRIETASATANGPVAALTAMLHDRGVALEMLRFHQLRAGGNTATFIEGTNGFRSEWAMGYCPDPTQSALSAVIACANRLHAAGD